jgi:hypothetical protein
MRTIDSFMSINCMEKLYKFEKLFLIDFVTKLKYKKLIWSIVSTVNNFEKPKLGLELTCNRYEMLDIVLFYNIF